MLLTGILFGTNCPTLQVRSRTFGKILRLCLSAFTTAAYILVHFRLDYIMRANPMNPHQTAPCLQNRLSMHIRKGTKEQQAGKAGLENSTGPLAMW